jgi:hypothetical protein
MRTVGKFIEPIVLLFIILILFQNCVVYEKSSVSLEWASKQELKAKVRTKDSETYKFNRILSENGHFFGLQKITGESTKTELQANKIAKVQLQDKSISTIASITTVLGFLILAPVFIFIIGGGLDF